jgi:hypothetical protein
MKKQIILGIFILISNYAISQNRCRLESLSKESKDELISFWDRFRASVMQRDTAKILQLCAFPFRVTEEILLNNRAIGKFYTLDSSNIMKYASLMFFEKQFEESLLTSINPIETLKLHGDFREKHKTCCYEFFYLIKDMNAENQMRSFSITRIDSVYKVTMNWIEY